MSSFLCDLLKKAQLLPIPSLHAIAQIPRSSILLPPSCFFFSPPSNAISLSGHQALQTSHLKISSVSVSERQSIIDWLTTNNSDALFTFCDAPTITPISPIVSAPDGDSNEYKRVWNRPSSPYISPSNFCERPRPSASFVQLRRHSSNFGDIRLPSPTFCT
jgi:hypothetical protein